jgi:hypothetical protein
MAGVIINERGFWENDKGHAFDAPLAANALEFFQRNKASSIIDLGCGTGAYTKYFRKGVKSTGVDGNPLTKATAGDDFLIRDLSKPFYAKFDWVFSVEVGEHIPKEFESTFIRNLVGCCTTGIVISWAIPGQDGDGHTNCQPNEYIVERLKSYNFCLDNEASASLRASSSLGWMRNTLMVFRRTHAFPKVCSVVGNGGSLLGCGRGTEICSRPVVRINNYVTHGFLNDVGSATDVWASSLYSDIDPRKDKVYVPFTQYAGAKPETLSTIKNIVLMPEAFDKEIQDVNLPSTGARLLYWMECENIDPVVYGFDRFTGMHHYYDIRAVTGREHSCSAENKAFEKIQKLRQEKICE